MSVHFDDFDDDGDAYADDNADPDRNGGGIRDADEDDWDGCSFSECAPGAGDDRLNEIHVRMTGTVFIQDRENCDAWIQADSSAVPDVLESR